MLNISGGFNLDYVEQRQQEIRDRIAENEQGREEHATSARHQRHLESLHHLLAQAERAKAKFHEGSYGRCDGCEAEIAHPDLQHEPFQTLCGDCRKVNPGN